jgi:hypothetical protein
MNWYVVTVEDEETKLHYWYIANGDKMVDEFKFRHVEGMTKLEIQDSPHIKVTIKPYNGDCNKTTYLDGIEIGVRHYIDKTH